MESLFQNALEVATTLRWDLKPAKLDGRMNLLTHSLNAMAVADRLMSAYEYFKVHTFSEEERRIVLSALFIHDFSKADEDISKQISEGKIVEIPKRLKNREEVIECLKSLGIDDSEIDIVIDHAISMEYAGTSDLEEFLSSKPVNRKIDRILKLSDRLAGINSVDKALRKSITDLAKPLDLRIHRISVLRGISTQLLHRALYRIFENNGWYPLLSTPDGTVYIGKGHFELSEEMLLSELLSEFRELIDSFGDDDIGSAAFGSFTSTAIKIPEFVFLSEKSAESFWNFIGSRDAIKNPPDLRKGTVKNIEALKTAKPRLSYEEYDYLFKLYNSMRYALMIGVAVIKEAEEISEELSGKIIENLIKRGVDVKSLIDANPRYNSPFPDVINTVDDFVRKLGLENERRDRIVEKTIEIFREATSKAVREFELNPLEEQLKELISDLSNPRIVQSTWKESYESYLMGKVRGTPVCPLCGNKADETGIASLVGKGTESFANLLPGGTTIGGENKAKICPSCIFEAKLRSLVGDVERFELFIIIPQTSIAPNLTEIFWSVAKEKLTIANFQSSAVPPIYDLTDWARIILNGEDYNIISKSVSEIIKESVESASKDKKIRSAIEKKIEELYGDFESFTEDFGENMGYEIRSMEDLLTLIFSGKEDVIEYLELENVIRRRKVEVILSSNYVVLLFDRIGRKDDPETVSLLRKIFVALIISKMFSSAVVISELPISVLTSVTPKGAVKAPLKLGIRNFIEPYTKDGWITFRSYTKLMRKLSALLILENKLLGLGSGSSTLYELTKMTPGRILHKIVEGMGGKVKKKNLKEILKLLKEVEG